MQLEDECGQSWTAMDYHPFSFEKVERVVYEPDLFKGNNCWVLVEHRDGRAFCLVSVDFGCSEFSDVWFERDGGRLK